MVFRKICDSTNVRLRMDLLYTTGDDSSIAAAKEVAAYVDLSLNDDATDVAIRAKVIDDSDHLEV